MLKKFYFLFLVAALLGGACSSSSTEDEGGNTNTGSNTGGSTGGGTTTGSTTEINGTTIQEGNNLVGLITDSTTGKGIAGVPVSDGYTIVVTDANGVYQMKASRLCRSVYYTTPANYKVALDPSTGVPLFYSNDISSSLKLTSSKVVDRHDFTLEPMEVEENFTLLAIGDPQCKTDSDVARYNNETIPDIKYTLNAAQASGRWTNAYAVTLGDITFDNTVQWDPMKKSMSNVQLNSGYLPIFQCMGNHDHDAGQTSTYTAQANFIERFGPVDYSFNRGKAHIVVMDDVVCTTTSGKTWTYGAGFSDAQYSWLQQDLALVENKSDKVVFFCAHIPFRGGGTNDSGANVNTDKYYKEVLTLLKQFKEAHIMIGHTHYPQNYIHTSYKCAGGLPIYEHVHGAACGGWWSSNLNVDGAPNGYSIYEIEGSTVKNWVAKSTNQPEDYQIRVYDGNAVYTGTKGYAYTWSAGGTGGTASIKTSGNSALAGQFIADIWDDDATNWKVEFIQNGVTTPMTRITFNIADMCATSFFFNELGKNTTSWNKALMHYWVYKPASGKPASETGWVIRATQTIPASGKVNVYETSSMQTDFSGFAAE